MAVVQRPGYSSGPAWTNALARHNTPAISEQNFDAQIGPHTQVAHTLTACTRCRQRKTRCDPQLPRCGPCERTSSVCEYYDANKGHTVNRDYVVFLQHKVRELERELECVETEDNAEDPEAMMRPVAVRVHDAVESKYLGPSSGIAITRLVMQLAKQFTDSKSIKDIVTDQRARQIKEVNKQEQAKPTSKNYPLISNVALDDLPNRNVVNLLIQLYKLKVQPMYPALHEPTLDADFETLYTNSTSATPSQNFICRMVIAISLQKMEATYAGLADGYYLGALKFLEDVIRPMNLQTLQAFALMAEYSLLTPTRTAIYYIMGTAVRLLQALGFHEEKTIVRGHGDAQADPLEIDMRRRVYWCIMVMDLGLAHSLGRPAMLATDQEHIDVQWFETCDDRYITPAGIDPHAQRPTLKKWIAIHFFKMRILQLEIRRKLYLKKRPEPRNDSHEWFPQMEAKLIAWRDASPSADEGHGLDIKWFIGRYNTMVVFMYRPSPQVPRPSLNAALKCFDACHYNISMHRDQISRKNVDTTWIFTQAIFMAINTMLWTLSYDEVRRRHSRALVEKDLDIAIEAISLASERWPGVASASQLYQKLITAILKIYEKDGDIPITATTPSDGSSPNANHLDANRSHTTSPASISCGSVATPPDPLAPHAQGLNPLQQSIEQPPPMPYQADMAPLYHTPSVSSQSTPPLIFAQPQYFPDDVSNGYGLTPQYSNPHFDPSAPFNPLPEWSTELTVPSWSSPTLQEMHVMNALGDFAQPSFDGGHHNGHASNQSPYPMDMGHYPYPQDPSHNPFSEMNMGVFGDGLNQSQQDELMRSLETVGMEDIQSMIMSTLAAIAPKSPTPSSVQFSDMSGQGGPGAQGGQGQHG